MNSKSIKISIGIISTILIAVYLIGLSITMDLWEELTYLSAVAGVGLMALPFLISYRKTGTILKPIPIIISVALFVSFVGIRGWNWLGCTYNLLISIWPFICYGFIRLITSIVKAENHIWISILAYNLVIICVIYLVEEQIFKTIYSDGDVIAEVFLYVVSQIALIFAIKKQCFTKPVTVTYVLVNLAVIAIWLCTQDRIVDIFESLFINFNSVDKYGEYYNWLAQRGHMLRMNVSGEYTDIYNQYYLKTVMHKCPLSFFHYEGYTWLSVVMGAVVITLNGILIKLAVVNKENNPLKLLVATLVLKNIVGLIANIFLFYSTSIGIIFIGNFFDIILMMWIMFTKKEDAQEIIICTDKQEIKESFKDMFFRLVDEKGADYIDICKKLQVDRVLISRIKLDENAIPSKSIVISFALELNLSLRETEELLKCAGYALLPNNTDDMIIKYYLDNKNCGDEKYE